METLRPGTKAGTVQGRWELRDGRLRLCWSLVPDGAAPRQPDGTSTEEVRAFPQRRNTPATLRPAA
jgi:hypothetical protein